MDREAALEVMWAKKTAVQRMIEQDQNETSFVCPVCGGTAYIVTLNDQRYKSHCENMCFSDIW